MESKTCTCKQFQADELPCTHALAVINKELWDPYEYCSEYYKNDTLKKTYEEVVQPISTDDSTAIPEEIIQEVVKKPIGRTKVGKPRKKRYRSCMEKISDVHCRNCGQTKHNRRSCKQIPTKDI